MTDYPAGNQPLDNPGGMTEAEFDQMLDAYLLEVRKKLKVGWEKWRDTNARNMSMDRLLQEVAEEAVDVVGWAFWIWAKTMKSHSASPFTPPPR